MASGERNLQSFGYSPNNVDNSATHKFHNILEQSDFSKYYSFQYILSEKNLLDSVNTSIIPQNLPNEFEIIAHLKLIKVLGILKVKVLAGVASYASASRWKQYVTNAVRRFMVFLVSLKKFMDIDLGYSLKSSYNQTHEQSHFQFASMMTQLMPPLDVIMVWYSFLSHPKSFYTVLTGCDMEEFANLPLPLHLINQFIDNTTFEFNVPHEYKHNYLQIIKCTTIDTLDSQYEVDRFGFEAKCVTITCPNCKHVISEPIKLQNEMETGFFDKKFATKNICFGEQLLCYCSKIEVLTHDELRKLQLFADASKEKSPLTYLHNSPPKLPEDLEKTSESFQKLFIQIWRSIQTKNLNDIILILEQKCITELLPQAFLLHTYRDLDLISMTVAGDIQIGKNLVELVLKQESFGNKINNLNWLYSSNISNIVSEATSRYSNFFAIVTDPKLSQNLKSTLDIDLVWHTHQLCAFGYFHDCLNSPSHCIIDQSDKISNRLMDGSETFTENLYRALYGQEYFICYCHNCSSVRYGVSNHVFDSTINANLCLENKILGIDLNMVYTSPQSNSIVGITPQSQQYPCICHNTNDFLTNAVTEETLDGEFMENDQKIVNSNDFPNENIDSLIYSNMPEMNNAFLYGPSECPNNEFLRLWCMI